MFVVLASAAAIGIGALLAALNVRYRDVRYVIPLLVQLWIFITPVAYSISLVPGRWRWVYALNPMVGVVEGFRWAFFGTSLPGRDVCDLGAERRRDPDRRAVRVRAHGRHVCGRDMSTDAIEVVGLGKRYLLGEREQYQALRDVLSSAPRRLVGRVQASG